MTRSILRKNDIFDFLDVIDEFLEDEITLVAVGGTAMVLHDLRSTTKDFDFTGPRNSIATLMRASRITRQEFKIDCWPDGQVLCFVLPTDYLDNSIQIKIFKKIDLRVLSPLDIVVTKLVQRNYEDIEKCIRKFDLTRELIIQRTLEGDVIPECRPVLLHNSYLYGLNLVTQKFFK